MYDAYYDENGEWLEKACGDPKCEFCANRPEKHSETCVKDFMQKEPKNEKRN